jgi:hypothetical protein
MHLISAPGSPLSLLTWIALQKLDLCADPHHHSRP